MNIAAGQSLFALTQHQDYPVSEQADKLTGEDRCTCSGRRGSLVVFIAADDIDNRPADFERCFGDGKRRVCSSFDDCADTA